MAITHSYVDYGAGSDATGDGTIGTPWKTLQKAFDTLTRNTTDGNQVNLKAGTAHVNSAALDLTTFIAGGALTAAAPLILRGYTSAANDGGIGEIDGGGVTMFAASTYDYIRFIDLELHTFGNNNGIVLDLNCHFYHCEVHKGASSPSGKYLLSLGQGWWIWDCYLHDIGTGAGRALNGGNYGTAYGGYINIGSAAGAYGIYTSNSNCYNVIVLCGATGQTGIRNASSSIVDRCVVYNTTSGTASGVVSTFTPNVAYYMNNIICGFSGVGGEAFAIEGATRAGHNAFWNNTDSYVLTDVVFVDDTANDVALAADPFTDAANGDFSLTAAAKAALAGKGWPTSYLGAHANTVPNLNIGPIQLAAGRPAFGDRSGGKF